MVHSLRLDPEGIFIDIKTILKTKSLPYQNHSRSQTVKVVPLRKDLRACPCDIPHSETSKISG